MLRRKGKASQRVGGLEEEVTGQAATTLNKVVKEGPPDKVSFKSSCGGEGASHECTRGPCRQGNNICKGPEVETLQA